MPVQRERDGKVVAELRAALAELQVAQEELRQQNEELARARREIERERQRYIELFELAPDGYVVTDAAGTVLEANRAAADLLNVAPRFLRRKPLGRYVMGDDQPAFWAEVARLQTSDEVRELTLCLRPRQRTPYFTAVTVAPVRDASGKLTALRWLVRDITERIRVEEHIRTLNAELEQRVRERTTELEMANRAKSDFLATMSHEIRTPLNAIIGYSELLEIGVGGDLRLPQREYVRRIHASGSHLIGLVSEILDMSRIEAGTLTVERASGRAGETVASAVALIRPQAAAARVRLTNYCPRGADVSYLGDQRRVRQILINLLSNAVKFTDAGGRVRITCRIAAQADAGVPLRHAGPFAVIQVEDTGIGISVEKQTLIFEPFVQGETGHTRGKGGTGLGLSISRRLARLMGGDVTVRSAVGEGSTFTLWIPAETAVTTPADAGPSHTPAPPEGAATDDARTGAASAPRVVDDVNGIVDSLLVRLRADRGTPLARDESDEELTGHFKTYLTEIGQALAIAETLSDSPEERYEALDGLMAGSDVQRLVCERHGAQRRRLGWRPEELSRELELLSEEVEQRIRVRASLDPELRADEAIRVLRGLIAQGVESSMRGYRLAGQAT
ncbi:MAG: PAS domain-containing sensor histidine kinase [Gemmatimonadaceae bacterium]